MKWVGDTTLKGVLAGALVGTLCVLAVRSHVNIDGQAFVGIVGTVIGYFFGKADATKP